MPFDGFTDAMGEFFIQIRLNNNSVFFQEHKAEYERNVKEPLYAFAQALAPAIEKVDPRLEVKPSKVVSRIRRDTRFARDKTPYRDHAWLSWRASDKGVGKSVLPGLYFAMDVGEWEVGCGYYDATPTTMRAFRQKVLASQSSFLSIVEEPIVKERFALYGEEYKRPKIPGGLDGRLTTWFRKRAFYMNYKGNWDKCVYEASFADIVSDYLLSLAPFYRFLSDLPILGE